MLSRVADAIYWMSRYFERAENIARMIDVNHTLALDVPEARAEWVGLIATLDETALFESLYPAPTSENVLHFLTFDKRVPSSIFSCLALARENARTVREVISSEMWEQVNEAYLRALEMQNDAHAITPFDYLAEVKKAAQLFVGITYLTMTHNEAWHFARLGRLLERADMTARILDIKHTSVPSDPATLGAALDELAWGAVLRSASGLEMYRKRHGEIQPSQVMAFLLFDQKFPRSVRYCTRKAERSLRAIAGFQGRAEDAAVPAQHAMHALSKRVECTDIGMVLTQGLRSWIEELQAETLDVGIKIYDSFFTLRV